MTAVSPPDRTATPRWRANAEYAAALIGEVPFFVEVNPRLPRTFGGNQLHVSDLVGFCERRHAGLVPLPAHPMGDRDRPIAGLVAERIPNGATLQAGHRRGARLRARPARRPQESLACTPSCWGTA